jgi:hypothetical protein
MVDLGLIAEEEEERGGQSHQEKLTFSSFEMPGESFVCCRG